MATSLEDLFRRIEKIDSLSGLWTAAVDYYGELGFGGVAYVLFDGRQNGAPVALLDSGFPDEAVQAY